MTTDSHDKCTDGQHPTRTDGSHTLWTPRSEWLEARARALALLVALPRPSDESVLIGLRSNRDGNAAGGRKARSGGERRGGSAERRARRQRMWVEWGGADAGYVPCVWCGVRYHRDAWWKDGGSNSARLPRFDEDKLLDTTEGGTYRIGNLVPACPTCNRGRARKPHGLGEPAWGDPVRNAMRVASAHGVRYDPGGAVNSAAWLPDRDLRHPDFDLVVVDPKGWS